MPKKKYNPIEQEDLLDQTYWSISDMTKLYPMSKTKCREIFNGIVAELTSENIMLMPCSPRVVPRDRILKLWPLDERGIRRAAKRKRELYEK